MFPRLEEPREARVFQTPSGLVELHEADCVRWLRDQPANTYHAVVTDPPYGMLEYTPEQIRKLRAGRGGVWRIPSSIGGHKRAPVPRFTVLDDRDLASMYEFFREWGDALQPALVPGAHVFIATSPLFSHIVSAAMADSGYEKRGEIVRLTQTLRGGDDAFGVALEIVEEPFLARHQGMQEALEHRRLRFRHHAGKRQDNVRCRDCGPPGRVSLQGL